MDSWQHIWHGLLEPLRYPFDWSERIFVVYLLTALAMAVVVYRDLYRRAPETVGPSLLRYLFPRDVYLHRSALTDYKFYLIDRVVFALLLPPLLLYIGPVAHATDDYLYGLFGPIGKPLLEKGIFALLLSTLAQILLNDFMLYVVHYLFHRVPTLWEFHKVHHSTEVLTPISAYRMHPVEVVLTMNVTALGAGILFGIFGYCMDATPPMLTIANVNVVQFLFYIVGFNLRHSHVPLGYGPWLSRIFVSPWMHQVHHSREARHIDKNMGFIFAFWDWMFGTLYVPKLGETYGLGLSDGEHTRFQSVGALYFRPFANIARRVAKAARPA